MDKERGSGVGRPAGPGGVGPVGPRPGGVCSYFCFLFSLLYFLYFPLFFSVLFLFPIILGSVKIYTLHLI